MVTKIKNYFELLEEAFNDLLDFFFPYKNHYFHMSTDEFLSYYHEKYHKISRRMLVYLFPFIIIYILEFVMTAGSFFVPSDWVEPRFRTFFFTFLIMTIGFFYTFGQELKGPLLLFIGNLLLLCEQELGINLFYAIFFTLLMLLNICRGKRFEYYKILAANVLQDKLRNELEDMELNDLMEKFNINYDIYQQELAKKNKEDDLF